MLRTGLHSGRRFVIVVDNYYDGDGSGGEDGDADDTGDVGGGGEDDDDGDVVGVDGGDDASIYRIKSSRS